MAKRTGNKANTYPTVEQIHRAVWWVLYWGRRIELTVRDSDVAEDSINPAQRQRRLLSQFESKAIHAVLDVAEEYSRARNGTEAPAIWAAMVDDVRAWLRTTGSNLRGLLPSENKWGLLDWTLNHTQELAQVVRKGFASFDIDADLDVLQQTIAQQMSNETEDELELTKGEIKYHREVSGDSESVRARTLLRIDGPQAATLALVAKIIGSGSRTLFSEIAHRESASFTYLSDFHFSDDSWLSSDTIDDHRANLARYALATLGFSDGAEADDELEDMEDHD